MFLALKNWAKSLKHNLYALYLAYHHAEVPLSAKIIAAMVVAYALSPIDLIPDFIPIIGYLDDMILLPLGIALAIKLMPETIWQDCRHKAQTLNFKTLPHSKVAAIVVVALWITAFVFTVNLYLKVE